MSPGLSILPRRAPGPAPSCLRATAPSLPSSPVRPTPRLSVQERNIHLSCCSVLAYPTYALAPSALVFCLHHGLRAVSPSPESSQTLLQRHASSPLVLAIEGRQRQRHSAAPRRPQCLGRVPLFVGLPPRRRPVPRRREHPARLRVSLATGPRPRTRGRGGCSPKAAPHPSRSESSLLGQHIPRARCGASRMQRHALAARAATTAREPSREPS